MGQRLDEQRQWIRAVAAATGLSVSALARKAGLAPSTLNKPLNDPDYDGELKATTLAEVSRVTGIPVMQFPGRPRGIGEVESQLFREQADLYSSATRAAVEAMLRAGNHLEAWIVRSSALDLEGIIPGDIVLIDAAAQPIGGRLVAAMVAGAGHQTGWVVRRYDPPFLLGTSTRGPVRPLVVDDDSVRIIGTVENVIRNCVLAA